jgi:hypothetical protein
MRRQDPRYKRFKAALTLAGVPFGKWAEGNGVTRQHLREVLLGRRESPRLIALVESFIEQHLSKVAA